MIWGTRSGGGGADPRGAATRVVLVTAAGPAGQVDIGVRSDATPADLAISLGGVIGVGAGPTVAEHHAPPRPGVPQGTRVRLDAHASLAASGVADGDLITFRRPAENPTTLRPDHQRGDD
jgi:hypothetical protein